MKEISTKVSDLLNKKYHIISHWNFLEFDQDFSILRERARGIKKDHYDLKDRIIVEHMDTDYYVKINDFQIGINLRNFFGVMAELDIPHHLFIFYTNHFGIKKEIDLLCENRHPNDRPTIIETFLSRLHYKQESVQNIDFNVDSVKFNMLCMMHLTRSHRNAAYRELDKIDRSKILLSGTNANF